MPKCLAVAILGALVCAALASGSVEARTRSITTHEVSIGVEAVPGYLAVPSGPGRHPAIVAFHDNWGVRDWLKLRVENLAAQGYVVLVVDFYHGKLPTDEADGEQMSQTLSRAGAYRDSEAAFDYLAARRDVDPARIGAIGWAMGGRYAMQLAVHEPRLAACVDNYGQFPTDPAEIEKINAAVLGIFGARDPELTQAKVNVLRNAMNAAGKSIEIEFYDDAAHEFLDPEHPRRDAQGQSLYRAQAAADVSTVTNAFFAKTLKPLTGQ